MKFLLSFALFAFLALAAVTADDDGERNEYQMSPEEADDGRNGNQMSPEELERGGKKKKIKHKKGLKKIGSSAAQGFADGVATGIGTAVGEVISSSVTNGSRTLDEAAHGRGWFSSLGKKVAKEVASDVISGTVAGVVQTAITNSSRAGIGQCSNDIDCQDDVYLNSCHCKNSKCQCPDKPPKSPRNPYGTNY